MAAIELDPGKDLEINTRDLSSEFKRLSLLLFRYYEQKAHYEREYDRTKASLEEIKAHIYLNLKKDTSKKHTEASLEAEIASNPDVRNLTDLMLDAKRDLSTWIGAVDSMKAKKDMIIQLGSDRRKEL